MGIRYFPNLDVVFNHPGHSIRQTMAIIDQGGAGISLLVTKTQQLIATISDGDIRRAILSGHSLDEPVENIVPGWPQPSQPPISASTITSVSELLQLMADHGIQQIPLVDDRGQVVDLALMWALHEGGDVPLKAVLMAGGFGTRLRPLTETIPKPMLPVNGKPLLELTINQMRRAGIRKVSITTHYLPDIIKQHLGDGAQLGVSLSYINEDQPMGTAGALSLLERTDEPLLVMNGDIMTDLDFRAMLNFHRQHDAMLTMAVAPYEYQIPYGVIEYDGVEVTSVREKPQQRCFINAGIYLIEPQVREHIPSNTPFSMTDLISLLIERGDRVVSFPIHEYWLDIGQHADYQRVQRDLKEGRVNLSEM